MDQVANSLGDVTTFLPWISFAAGVTGSLHCVGMCGGLVTASCEKSKDIFHYQVGRLVGYLLLGFMAGLIGSIFSLNQLPPFFSLIPAFIIGTLFIFWGWQNLKGKKAELPVPKFLRKFYTTLWLKYVLKSTGLTKALFTGLISILLPCGLLYGVVLSTVAYTQLTDALVSMFFFWLGTVPSMVLAPGIIHRILKPLKQSLPRTYAIGLMLVGVMTITFRTYNYIDHSIAANEKLISPDSKKSSCH